jgi:hypothetical protein
MLIDTGKMGITFLKIFVLEMIGIGIVIALLLYLPNGSA